MRLLYLVRHAAVTVEPGVPAPRWRLSDAGREAARQLAAQPRLRALGGVVSSPEPKAQETAEPIAAAAGLPLGIDLDLREVRRDPTPVTSSEEYEAMVGAWLASPEERVNGWEPAADARRRIDASIERLVRGAEGALAVVSHGLVLSLYVAGLEDKPVPALEEWRAIPLPALAVVDPAGRRLVEPFS